MSIANRLARYYAVWETSQIPESFPHVFIAALSLDVNDETWDATLAFVAKELGTEDGES